MKFTLHREYSAGEVKRQWDVGKNIPNNLENEQRNPPDIGFATFFAANNILSLHPGTLYYFRKHDMQVREPDPGSSENEIRRSGS
jgi:hypothetical protein